MWSTELILMIRHYIDDLDETNEKYSDSRLTELIIISAMKVKNEVSFPLDYSVNLETLDITPDPTEGSTRNEDLLILVGYKAAAFLTASEAKTASGQALSIRDGSSAVDLRGIAQHKLEIAKFYEKGYEDARFLYMLADRPTGVAIMGPTSILSAGLYGGNGAGGFYSTYTFRSRPFFN